MSLWRPETLHLGISAGTVTGVRLRHGQYVAATAIAVSSGTLEGALAEIFGQAARTARSAQVVIDDALGQLFVVKRPRGLRGLAEFDAVVAARFATLTGQSPEAWQLIADPQIAGETHLACALPRLLLTQIRHAARASRVRLSCMNLNFVANVNLQLRSQGAALNGDGLFASVGRTTITIAQRLGGNWSDVRVAHLAEQAPMSALEALLAHERLALGQVKQRLDLACGMRPAASGEEQETLSFRWLDQPQWPGQAREWSRQFRLALAGVWP